MVRQRKGLCNDSMLSRKMVMHCIVHRFYLSDCNDTLLDGPPATRDGTMRASTLLPSDELLAFSFYVPQFVFGFLVRACMDLGMRTLIIPP